MDENPELYRLEGTDNEVGGLLVTKKKPSEHTFKKPQTSIFGLDKLAEKKRRENSQEPGASTKISSDSYFVKDRRYRSYAEETPTHTGGVAQTAKERLEARLKRQKLDKMARDRDRDRRRDRDRGRDRDRDHERERNRHGSSRSHGWSPRFKDEPQTPKYRVRVRKYKFKLL